MVLSLIVSLIEVDSIEALVPLQQCYEDSFQNLRTFYTEARKMRYLSSIIVVPDLPNRAPFRFEEKQQEKRKSIPGAIGSNKSNATQPAASSSSKKPEPVPFVEELLIDFDGPSDHDIYNNFPEDPETHYGTSLPILQQQVPLAIGGIPSQEDANQVGVMMKMMLPLNDEIFFWRNKYEELERAYAALTMSTEANQAQFGGIIEPLNNEVAFWKQKYEEMAKLYQNLRFEHTDLLRRYELLKAQHSACQTSSFELSKLQSEIKVTIEWIFDFLMNILLF